MRVFGFDFPSKKIIISFLLSLYLQLGKRSVEFRHSTRNAWVPKVPAYSVLHRCYLERVILCTICNVMTLQYSANRHKQSMWKPRVTIADDLASYFTWRQKVRRRRPTIIFVWYNNKKVLNWHLLHIYYSLFQCFNCTFRNIDW